MGGICTEIYIVQNRTHANSDQKNTGRTHGMKNSHSLKPIPSKKEKINKGGYLAKWAVRWTSRAVFLSPCCLSLLCRKEGVSKERKQKQNIALPNRTEQNRDAALSVSLSTRKEHD